MSGHSAEERYLVTMNTRRRWSRAERLVIVGEIGNGSVSAIARRHNIAPSLLFRWRRELSSEIATAAKVAEPEFVRVGLPALPERAVGVRAAGTNARDSIEIVLGGDRRIIVGKDFDGDALRRVIAALESR